MTNLTLVIGNKNYSSWSLRPWVLMKHFNVEFTEKRIPLSTSSTMQELSSYPSDYKVPILQDGDLIVWDSLAIAEYISEKYLDNRGWPAVEKARAEARSISAEMHSSFVNIRTEMPMNCRRTISPISLSEQALQEVERIKALWEQCRSKYASQGDWLFGEYSIADAMFAPIVLRFMSYAIPVSGQVEGYIETVLNQPSIIGWIEAGRAEKEVIQESEI